jgi:hypothetical protein
MSSGWVLIVTGREIEVMVERIKVQADGCRRGVCGNFKCGYK